MFELRVHRVRGRGSYIFIYLYGVMGCRWRRSGWCGGINHLAWRNHCWKSFHTCGHHNRRKSCCSFVHPYLQSNCPAWVHHRPVRTQRGARKRVRVDLVMVTMMGKTIYRPSKRHHTSGIRLFRERGAKVCMELATEGMQWGVKR